MKQIVRRISLSVLLLMCCVVMMARGANANVVVEAGIENGTVEATVSGLECTLTVTPAAGYYIRKSDITVRQTVDPSLLAARAMESGEVTVPVAEDLVLEGPDGPVQEATEYTFKVPDGYGAYVTATFHEQEGVTVTMGAYELRTYSANVDLDFSDEAGPKAYICNAYDREQNRMVMLRVTSVPAGTGVLLRGTPGAEYTVKQAPSSTVLVNLLVGAVGEVTLAPTAGSMTNFVLAPLDEGVAFRNVSEEGTFGPNKAYLQLPTSVVGSSRTIALDFDDTPTGIADPQRSPFNARRSTFYDLQGRKLGGQPVKHGVYLYNGKKVVR